MNIQKVKDWCREVGENLIELYERGYCYSSYLQFPNKRKEKIKRVSEQEARFMFAHKLEMFARKLGEEEKIFYAVEVPTENRYADFTDSNPQVYLDKKGEEGRSGHIDISVFQDHRRPDCESHCEPERGDNTKINIEFKQGQPTEPAIKKDLLKLLFEESQMGVFYHVFEYYNANSITCFLNKFNKSINEILTYKRKLIVKHNITLPKILLFIVVLKDRNYGRGTYFDHTLLPNIHQKINLKYEKGQII